MRRSRKIIPSSGSDVSTGVAAPLVATVVIPPCSGDGEVGGSGSRRASPVDGRAHSGCRRPHAVAGLRCVRRDWLGTLLRLRGFAHSSAQARDPALADAAVSQACGRPASRRGVDVRRGSQASDHRAQGARCPRSHAGPWLDARGIDRGAGRRAVRGRPNSSASRCDQAPGDRHPRCHR